MPSHSMLESAYGKRADRAMRDELRGVRTFSAEREQMPRLPERQAGQSKAHPLRDSAVQGAPGRILLRMRQFSLRQAATHGCALPHEIWDERN